MNKNLAVLTAVGHDRIGIVDDLTSLIEEKAANILESRMAVLGGEFAVIMLVSGEKRSISGLIGNLDHLEKETGLHIEIKPTNRSDKDTNGIPYILKCISLDGPGIIHSVTRFIRSEGINIENLETETAHAPWTGAPLFKMKANVIVPLSVSVQELRKGLSRLEHEKDLDISFKAVTGKV
ncbi:ACT domain-containing protein [Oceanispirochaeta sp.]|jgi:glycine cleavage system transcriptional repressor|uniref:glycine cleavage system protein R n=1 Tax=Oceanispirochaeta sp. TaxID=2035350 RepID=UPI00262C87B1|nr:ACT domain-containing protein [Oceanispirochaeta sp.]MDA3958405.1 amino acid-binding protein [Oceanispirochaeta sp.]